MCWDVPWDLLGCAGICYSMCCDVLGCAINCARMCWDVLGCARLCCDGLGFAGMNTGNSKQYVNCLKRIEFYFLYV